MLSFARVANTTDDKHFEFRNSLKSGDSLACVDVLRLGAERQHDRDGPVPIKNFVPIDIVDLTALPL